MGSGSRGHRLHPSSPLFDLFGSVRNLIFVGIAALVAAGGDRADLIIGVVIGVGAALQGLRWFVTWYRLDESELVVSSGLVFRNERHVPYRRIENLDLKRGPVHRWLGVAEVRVQTASGSEPEAVLRVLSMPAIETMRSRIGARRGERVETEDAEAGEEAAGEPLVRLGLEELARLGVISNRSLVLVGAGLGVAWQFGLWNAVESAAEDARVLFAGMGAAAWAAIGVVGAVVAAVGLLALGVAWSIVRFYGFTLRRVGDDFRMRCGLLTELAASVPRRRVQLVSVHESPLHRLFGRVTVRVETAGGVAENDDATSRKWFVPLLPAGEAGRIVGEVMPGVALDGVEWHPLARGGARRMVFKTVVIWALIGAGVGLVFRPWGIVAGVAILPVVGWYAARAARFMGWGRQGDAVFFRSGVWMRKTSVTREDRVQVVSVKQNPFDRRWGHASVSIDTAGAGPAGHRIDIPYLEEGDARRWRASVEARVG